MLKWEEMTGYGKPDILRQNKTLETLYIWYMNGTTVTGGVSITGPGDLNREAVEVGNFSKDGKPDISCGGIMQPGQNAVWFMNGAGITGSAGLTHVGDTSWEIVGPK